MKDNITRISSILYQLRQKAHLSENDLDFAEYCLSAEHQPLLRANACEIAICGNAPEPMRSNAVIVLKDLCRESSDDDWVIPALHTLMYVVDLDFFSHPEFINFARSSSQSSRWEIRCNSVPILARSFKNGDALSEACLRHLLHDDNEFVSSNAKTYLG